MNKLQDSVLYPIYEQVIKQTDLDVAKKLIHSHLDTLKLRGADVSDIKRMRFEIDYNIKTVTKLQFWLFNNMLAYAGNKVTKLIAR